MGVGTFGTGSVTLSAGTSTFTVIPGLSTTITVPDGAFVYLASDGGVTTTATTADSGSIVDVVLVADNALLPNGGYAQLVAANSTTIPSNMTVRWNLSAVTFLSAGTHTIDVRAVVRSGADALVSGDNTTIEQGSLSVLILKQ